jgi:hypothetical protein
MKIQALLLFLIISLSSFSQETQKRILFRGDSTWYAAENQILFSSENKGISWDTILAKRSSDTVFFSGILDTATNVFISDQRTLFVFAWDGTMHYGTFLFCSSDRGKSWNKSTMLAFNGIIGVKYLHKVSSTYFILDRRSGYYSITEDAGHSWKNKCAVTDKFSCADEKLTFLENGHITFRYSRGQKCKDKFLVISTDNGKTWIQSHSRLYAH